MENAFKKFFRFFPIFIIIFFIGNYTNAYFEDFDSYSDGDQINSKPYWELSNATELVSNTYSTSSPNSLRQAGNVEYYYNIDEEFDVIYFSFRNRHDTNVAKSYNVYGFDNVICSSPCYLIDNIFDFGLRQSDDLIYFSASSSEHLLLSGPVIDTWYYAKIEYDKTNNLVKGTLLNNGATSGWLPIKATLNGSPLQKIMILGNTYSGNYFYTDDLIINTTSLLDKISFINPAESSISTLSDFYWEYQLSISTSTYWTTYEWLNVDLLIFHTTSGEIDSTSTFSVLRYPMSDFVPLSTYDFIVDDPLSFPDRTGAYYAGINLLGVLESGASVSLATDLVIFGIATSTSGYNPSGWCSGLCVDLATSTSPEWWEFWDWSVDDLGATLLCAGRYTICYAVQPHSFSTAMFNDIYEDFKTVFPFNAFFEIASTTENAFASSTMSNDQTFGIPMINSEKHLSIIPVLSSSTLSSFIGTTNAGIFRTTIGYLFYAFTASLILLIIW